MATLNSIGESLPIALAYIAQIILLVMVIVSQIFTLQTPIYRTADIVTHQATALVCVAILWLLMKITAAPSNPGGE